MNVLLYFIKTNQGSNTRNKHDSENAAKSIPQKTAQMFQTVQAEGLNLYDCY